MRQNEKGTVGGPERGRPRHRARWPSFFVALGLILGATTAQAQANPPGTIPYQGVLSLNGELMSGDVDLRFTVELGPAPDPFQYHEEAEDFTPYRGSVRANDDRTAFGLKGGGIFTRVTFPAPGLYTLRIRAYESDCDCPAADPDCNDSTILGWSAGAGRGTLRVTGTEAEPQILMVRTFVPDAGGRRINLEHTPQAALCADGATGRTLWLDWLEIERSGHWFEEWSTLETRSCAEPCPIPLYHGSFSVPLGLHQSGLEAIAQAGEPMLLSIEVGTEGGEWVSLGGPQQLAPLPYSLWASGANDMAVDSATVSGNVTTGALTTGSVTAGGEVYAEDELSVAHELYSNSSISVTNASATADINARGTLIVKGNDILFASGTNGDGGSALQRDSVADTLTINSGGVFAGGSQFNGLSVGSATIQGDLEVDSLTLEGAGSPTDQVIRANYYPFIAKSFEIVGGGSTTTGVGLLHWECWVASFDFDGGSVHAGDNQDIVRAYTYPLDSYWYVYADFATDSDTTARVGVVCVHDVLMDSTGSWF